MFAVLTNQSLWSQANPISISIAVNPPYSTNFSEYFSSASQTIVTIVNTSNENLTVFLAGSVSNLTVDKSVRIPANEAPQVPPLVLQPGIRILTGNELTTLINPNSLDYNGLTQAEVLNGNLPEGLYQICLQAIDYTTLEPRSAQEPVGCSNVFQVSFAQPPLLILPVCGTEVHFSSPQNILFSWVPPTGLPFNSVVSYRIKLFEIQAGQNPIQVIQSATVPIINETVNNNFFLMSAIHPALQSGHEFVWQITVEDLAGQAIFSNQGKSEICTFRIGLPPGSNDPVQAVIIYPKPGAKIPFVNVPIIARYTPFSTSHNEFRSQTSLSSTISNVDNNVFNQNWPLGRETFVQQQINQAPTLEQLLHVSIGRNLALSPGSAILSRGAMHTIQSDIQLIDANGTSSNTTASSSFESGMPAPKLVSPINDTSITNHTVSFKISPENFPVLPAGQNQLLPPTEILKSTIGTNPYLFIAKVNENCKIEISRYASFDTIISTKFAAFNIVDTIKSSHTEQALRLKFKKQLVVEEFLPDTGRYFWRASWLRNHNDSLSAPYITSQTGQFFIHDGVAGEQVNSACMGECDSPLPSDRTAVTTVVVGDSVSIGRFTMRVTEISYLGPAARGKGTIKVPFWNSNLKVSFNDLQINTSREVFSGSAGADYDNASYIPNVGQGGTVVTLPKLDSLQQFLDSRKGILTEDSNMPVGLPIGIDKKAGGEQIVIGVIAASFRPDKATLAAGVNIPFYGLKDLLDTTSGIGLTNIALGASDICFHPGGLAGVSMGTLFLPEDIEFFYAKDQTIKLNGSRVDALTGAVADSGCYVSWDCEGFRALNIKGAIKFDSTLLVSEGISGKPNPKKPVEARFGFQVRQTGNWIADLDFDKFQLPGIDGWGFHVKQAALDFSDLSNPSGMQFPTNYQGDRSVLWTGIHLKELQISLPPEFDKKEETQEETQGSNQNEAADNQANIPLNGNGSSEGDLKIKRRTSFNVRNLLIDKSGVSGSLTASKLISLEQGTLEGWGFSVDSIGIEITSNSFSRGGFNGNIVSPISPDTLKYSSILSQSANSGGLRYEFRVQPEDTISVPMWVAKMNLLPTSTISIAYDTSGFRPSMNLNGNISIDGKVGEIPVTFIGMHFQQLQVQTRAPFVSCNSFSFASPQKKMAGFPISINNISIGQQPTHGMWSWDDTEGPRTALNFSVNVAFTGEESTLEGRTDLAILARLDMGDLGRDEDDIDPNPDKFDFPSMVLTGVDLKTISMDCEVAGNGLKGSISFYAKDSIYGTGFIGGIELSVKEMCTAKAILCVGSVEIDGPENVHEYWYADLSARFTPGIPIYSGLELFGGGGGVSYGVSFAEIPPPGTSIEAKEPPPFPTPGSTLSAIRLVPNSNAGFGLKLTIMFGSTGGGQVYNADVTVSGIFSQSGGLLSMGLEGNAYFVTNPIDRSFKGVQASMNLQFDVPNVILTGLFSVMINVPLTMTGRLPGNIAGNAYLYAGPDKWQILVGAPDIPSRVGIKVANMFDLNGYMMAGQQLPPPPSPPEIIETILGPGTIVRSPGISSGTGLAFGAAFIPPKFDEKYLVFSAKLDAEIGFDMNMFDYGSTSCDGGAESERLGINGWYATGSAYAYFTGTISIDVDYWGEVQTFKIIDVNAAALLQTGFPNPAWMKGTIGGNYEILGGLVKGNCRYELMIGDKCEPPLESPLAGLKMIGDVSPQASSTDVDCGVAPSASFNVDLDSPFTITKNNADGTQTNETFRFTLESFTLKKGSSLVATSLSKSTDHSRAMISPSVMLLPYSQYTVSLKVKAEKFVGGSWVQAKRVNNSDINEMLTMTFTTGALPDRIRAEDVQYSLPLHKQRFFAQNSCDNGFIQLRQDMGYLFSAAPAAGYQREYYARFIPATGSPVEAAANWIASSKRVNFIMPQLASNKIYKVQIIHRDTRIAGSGSSAGSQLLGGLAFQNVSTQYASMAFNNAQIRNRTLTGSSGIANNEYMYYEYSFRTGMYSTLSDKVNALSAVATIYENYNPYEILALKLSGPEILEKYEVEGFTYMNGLTPQVFRILDFSDMYSNSWHTTHIKPVIYDLNKRLVNNNYTTRRLYRSTPDLYGIPPTKIVVGNSLASPLRDSEIYPGMVSSSSNLSTFAILAKPAGGSFAGSSSSNNGFALNSPMFGNNNPTCMLILETSWMARSDYNRMGVMVANVISRYGTKLSGVDATTKVMINRYLSTSYKNMFRGNYQIRISSVAVSGCSNPAPAASSVKSFVY